MGTRALVKIFNGEKEIACIYRQCDGYPDGLGSEVAEFVTSRPFVNGIGDSTEVFNGMGCFAAQLVGALKTHAGNVYLYAPGSVDVGEEFIYEIHGGNEKRGRYAPLPVTAKVIVYGEEKFNGPIADLATWCKADHDEDDPA